jgi:hypothetical protein
MNVILPTTRTCGDPRGAAVAQRRAALADLRRAVEGSGAVIVGLIHREWV